MFKRASTWLCRTDLSSPLLAPQHAPPKPPQCKQLASIHILALRSYSCAHTARAQVEPWERGGESGDRRGRNAIGGARVHPRTRAQGMIPCAPARPNTPSLPRKSAPRRRGRGRPARRALLLVLAQRRDEARTGARGTQQTTDSRPHTPDGRTCQHASIKRATRVQPHTHTDPLCHAAIRRSPLAKATRAVQRAPRPIFRL